MWNVSIKGKLALFIGWSYFEFWFTIMGVMFNFVIYFEHSIKPVFFKRNSIRQLSFYSFAIFM